MKSKASEIKNKQIKTWFINLTTNWTNWKRKKLLQIKMSRIFKLSLREKSKPSNLRLSNKPISLKWRRTKKRDKWLNKSDFSKRLNNNKDRLNSKDNILKCKDKLRSSVNLTRSSDSSKQKFNDKRQKLPSKDKKKSFKDRDKKLKSKDKGKMNCKDKDKRPSFKCKKNLRTKNVEDNNSSNNSNKRPWKRRKRRSVSKKNIVSKWLSNRDKPRLMLESSKKNSKRDKKSS